MGKGPGPLCLHSAVVFQGFMVVTGGCPVDARLMWNKRTSKWEVYCEKMAEGVWTLNRKTEKWLLLTDNSSPVTKNLNACCCLERLDFSHGEPQ